MYELSQIKMLNYRKFY